MTEQAAEAAADIFISYARDDADFAARLRDGITGGGFSVWIDTASLAAGERWTKEIESAIEGATSVVVVVSASSNESVWVRREVLYAQQLDKRVVPVLAEQVQLPVHLINLNALALHEGFDAGLGRLLDTLRGQPAGATAAAVKKATPIHVGKALWLFAGAAVVLVLAVITAQGEGVVAEVLATGLAIGGVLLGVAWKADDAISLEFKRDLSLWLDGVDPAAVGRSIQRWPEHFAALFDRVFGKKHLSLRCFFRSCAASLLAFVLCTLIFMQAAPGDWAAFLRASRWVATSLGEPVALSPMLHGIVVSFLLAFFMAFLNLLPDYISLLETRYVIQRMRRSRSITGQLGWLLVDFVATGAIFFLFLGAFIVLLTLSFVGWREAGEILIHYFSEFVPALLKTSLLAPVRDQQERFVAIAVWTTYFTTVWAWLYFIAQFLVRLVTPLRHSLKHLKYVLPVKQRPLRAVGQLMALLACAGYCLVMLPVSSLTGNTVADPLEPKMVDIPPGSFQIDFEGSVRKLTFTEPFAIGKYEVTFEEYDRFARATSRALPNDEGWGRGRQPVINVSWEDGVAYAEWLSEQTGKRYHLPTEVEWHWAANAVTNTDYWWGDVIGQNNANCDGCGSQWDGKQTAPVGSFAPNPWGLYDTAGNIWEWTQDCWHENFEGAPEDGSAWLEANGGNCSRRVMRGGSWNSSPGEVRPGFQHWSHPEYRSDSMGFRLAQDL